MAHLILAVNLESDGGYAWFSCCNKEMRCWGNVHCAEFLRGIRAPYPMTSEAAPFPTISAAAPCPRVPAGASYHGISIHRKWSRCWPVFSASDNESRDVSIPISRFLSSRFESASDDGFASFLSAWWRWFQCRWRRWYRRQRRRWFCSWMASIFFSILDNDGLDFDQGWQMVANDGEWGWTMADKLELW